jgi:aryl-alcohol dehydrogenase-like predicted oxidoreductase
VPTFFARLRLCTRRSRHTICSSVLSSATFFPIVTIGTLSRLHTARCAGGLLSGRMTGQTKFAGDDLRKNDPKFQAPRFAQYLRAVERLDRFAQVNYGKRVIQLALRWILDRQDSTIALWGARRPDQLAPIAGLSGWHIDASAMVEIDRILSETIVDAVGPEFMAPPNRRAA